MTFRLPEPNPAAVQAPDVGPWARPSTVLAAASDRTTGSAVGGRGATVATSLASLATTVPAEGVFPASGTAIVATEAPVVARVVAPDPDAAHEAHRIADAVQPPARSLTDQDIRGMATGLSMVHDVSLEEAEHRIRAALVRGARYLECP